MQKILIFIFLLANSFVQAQTVSESSIQLPQMTLKRSGGLRPSESLVEKKIISGKKVQEVKAESIPTVPNNNYRQVVAEIPGVITSEVNNESFMSVTTRGLGDPHESFNILLLRNGLPAAADPYGYPAAYYAPPAEALESVRFYRGGAGLLFGPQPGGAFDMRLRTAPSTWQTLQVRTTNLGGSFGRYSSYTESTHSNGNFGHLLSLHFRGADDFREDNADSSVVNPRMNFRWNLDDSQAIQLDLDYYDGEFGEPGGLARTPTAGTYSFSDDFNKSTLQHDRLLIKRSSAILAWEKKWNDSLSSDAQIWITGLNRTSRRQTLGAAPAFGGIAIGTENRIAAQEFTNMGSEIRLQKDYSLIEADHTLTVGLGIHTANSPFTQENGSSPTATSGTLTRDINRETNVTSFVVENAFRFQGWTVTPGVRAETIQQKIDEKLNVGSAVPLRKSNQSDDVTLLGLGTEYKWENSLVTFLNLSEGFKPASFQDVMPLGTGDTVSEDIKEARTWSRELGLRGGSEKTSWEASVFDIRFSNQFGRVGTQLQNVGASKSEGVDISVKHRLTNRIEINSALTWLKARITRGPLAGNESQYSPDQMAKIGVRYDYSDDSQIHVQNQWISEHFGDDANSANFAIPSYNLWDISGEQTLPKILESKKTLLKWGVQNVFDHKYFSRVRSNGVEPGTPRSVYGGLTLVY